MSPYWYCSAWGQKGWVERTGVDRQLQWIKTESEKDLELVSSCGCSSCNWRPGSDIRKIERLAGEVKGKESSIELLQKVALLGTAKIVRHVLETWGCWVQLALQEIYRNYELNRDKHKLHNHRRVWFFLDKTFHLDEVLTFTIIWLHSRWNEQIFTLKSSKSKS